ncbi:MULTISPECIES: hypothetical protein [unclassified Chryseobacterium]|uniref:hypothetical protein n=1 Tax=unclassified Chryseobacterium TaxID=2593645 RepID=UPI0012F94F44|nr:MULTISPECIES: hypothetical protein [unclassified Chryseobacterium]
MLKLDVVEKYINIDKGVASTLLSMFSLNFSYKGLAPAAQVLLNIKKPKTRMLLVSI